MRERPKGGSASRGGLKAGSRLRLFGAGARPPDRSGRFRAARCIAKIGRPARPEART
jgi:hypothetical protein